MSSAFYGPEGNRTPVRKPIPCSSTIISCSFTFPPPYENKHPYGFSSFMLRPYTQSLIYVVSHKIDARFLMCECIKADSSIKLRMLNYLQRLILILPFHAPHADSFTSCMIPVETSTTPYWMLQSAENMPVTCFPSHRDLSGRVSL